MGRATPGFISLAGCMRILHAPHALGKILLFEYFFCSYLVSAVVCFIKKYACLRQGPKPHGVITDKFKE